MLLVSEGVFEVKQKKSESELVHQYANKVIEGKASRGHTDKRFNYTKREGTVNKELWLDVDFFFSVVFESAEQKYEFLKQLKVPVDEEERVQIVNGLKLAEKLGIKLQREKRMDYPYGSLDLRPFVMDNLDLKNGGSNG